jgi:hypothetical protein
MIKISDLKKNPNNPRLIKDDKFQKLVKSIENFPKMMELRPIIVNDQNIVLGGNMRLAALKELGYKEIPNEWVKQAKDLTQEQQNEFIVKDNVSFGAWDWEMIANEWDAEQVAEWGLDVPDFGADAEILEAEEDDFEGTPPKEPITVLGDLYEIGEHRLLCGDSTQTDTFEKLMQGEMADMVVTDPPYNVAYEGKTKDALTIENDSMSNNDFYIFLYDFFTACNSYLRNGGTWYVWQPDKFINIFVNAFIQSGNKFSCLNIWVKNTLVMGRGDYHSKHETCIYGWKEGEAQQW